MRTAALAILLLCTLAVPGRAQDAPSYRALLARAQAGDTTVSFTALRQAWAASPEYAPYGSGADKHADSLEVALGRRDWARAVREADAALAVTWLDATTHAMKAYAVEQMGDTAAAERERAVARRLVESVTESGDGTERSPYVVVTVAEEYAVLAVARLRRGSQTRGNCGQRECDVLEATDPGTGKKYVLYFDITLPFAHLGRMLQGAGKP